jgi:hypothetical protein
MLRRYSYLEAADISETLSFAAWRPGVVHATVPRHHLSEPRPGRQKAPPGRVLRAGSQVIATIALMSVRRTATITRAGRRIVFSAVNAWGLRTCEGLFPHVFPLLNPFDARTEEAGQSGKMPIRKRQNFGLDSRCAGGQRVSNLR